MIKITLPDKTVKDYSPGTTGIQVCTDIGPKLTKDAIAIEINDHIYDLQHEINEDSKIRIITKKDPDGLDILRHSTAHLLANAVLNLYPDVKYGTGPAIDNGFYYDFYFKEPISESDLKNIENEMVSISNKSYEFKKSILTIEEAKKRFESQKYKKELIDSADTSEGIGHDNVTIYSNGDFSDLCLGPHVLNTDFIKHFKLLKVAGAYWRGNELNDQLQRIYGTSWFSKKDLEMYLNQREEAAKRDHRKLGNTLDLFISPDELGSGQYIWKPKGALLRDTIEVFTKSSHLNNGYELVKTPHIGLSKLWEKSGHLDYYSEVMYPPMKSDDEETYYLKPMNCPFHILTFQSNLRSYRELPIRYFELGSVYRYEKTGVLHGLLRARGFTQDDAHIFCSEDQLSSELNSVLKFSIALLNSFGFKDIEADLSTRPSKSIGDDSIWNISTESLENALIELNVPFKIANGEGAFYGPKIDLHVKDAIGRRWQLSTIQVDFAQPKNFDLKYVTNNNESTRPVMIHRALLGSIERFTGILLENYNGILPGWLSPDQIIILPITSDSNDYIKTFHSKLNKYRMKIDNTNVRLSEKIKKYKLFKVPVIIIVGDNDIDNDTMAINFSNGDNLKDIQVSEGLSLIKKYLKTPLLKL